MNHSLVAVLLEIFKWASILLCAYSLILGGIALFGFVFNLIKFLFRKDKFFRYFYLVKLLLSALVAYAYYFLYRYKGFSVSVFNADPPKTTILLIVCLSLPVGLLMAIDHFLLNEPVRN
ncbi:MAG TPA: hypothetical protein VIJ93_10870 [bacterium]